MTIDGIVQSLTVLPGENERLGSWKEIADYLDRDVRTAIRWEKKGMPVYRVPGGKRHAVFAYRSEIDRWLTSSTPQSLSAARTQRLLSRRAFGAAAAVLLLAGIIVWSVTALDYLRPKRPSGLVDHVSVLKDELLAHDEKGDIVWTFSFDQPVDLVTGTDLSGRSRIADVDGDGVQEVLVFVLFKDLGKGFRDRLYCFSAGGELLWQFEFKETLKFGSREFKPPWLFRALLIYQSAAETRIACALSHDIWWPAPLLLLNRSGQVVGQFVHAGWLTELNVLETPSAGFLLAGGHSNSQRAGVLVVLDANQFSGASPEQSASEYECQNCPPGRPLRYFVFSRSEMNALLPSVWHKVDTIRPTSGRIEVQTVENPHHGVASIFEFSSNFELENATFSDAYADAHRQLEKEKKLDHALEDCPERQGPGPVRSWDPENGWITVLPVAGASASEAALRH